MTREEKAKEMVTKVNNLLNENKKLTITGAKEIAGYKKTTFNDNIRGLYYLDKAERQYKPVEGVEVKEDIKPLEDNKKPIEDTTKALNEEQLKILLEIIEERTQKIEVPKGGNDNFKTTVRLNDKVWKKFVSFTSGHKNKSAKEHLNLALIEYITKYK